MKAMSTKYMCKLTNAMSRRIAYNFHDVFFLFYCYGMAMRKMPV